MDMKRQNSQTRDIWSSNSSKFFHTMKTRSASISDYSREVIGSDMNGIAVLNGSRSRVHSVPFGDGLKSESKFDIIEDSFSCPSPTSTSSNLPLSKCFQSSDLTFPCQQVRVQLINCAYVVVLTIVFSQLVCSVCNDIYRCNN